MPPRPLPGEPLPLDLLNTAWIAADGRHDLLAEKAGAREWLELHGLEGPSGAGARRKLIDTREALRALLEDRAGAAPRAAVNAVLAHGVERTELTGAGLSRALEAPAGWVVPWRCATALFELLDARGDRIKACANPECVLWFLDVSRPGTRRWCSMATCGNRDKAVRHGRITGKAV